MSDKSRVVIVPCGSYDAAEVTPAVRLGMELIEKDGYLIASDQNILVKPNFLCPVTSEDAPMCTHPSVFEGVVRYLMETGRTHLSYGDSPGTGSCAKVARSCGVLEAAQRLGIPEGDFETAVHVEYPEGHVARDFQMSKAVVDADAIVNVSKMKTHALERITGAVKIAYGYVQGYNKAMGHARFPDARRFAAMLADLNLCVRPRIQVMDGIIAMEGNGPASGDPVKMGVLLFSTDPVALDSVFCHLVHLDPQLVYTCVMGAEYSLGVWRQDQIEVVLADVSVPNAAVDASVPSAVADAGASGVPNAASCVGVPITMAEAVERFGNPDFDVHREREVTRMVGGLAAIPHPFSKRPFIDAHTCVHCGVCVEHCPVEGKALAFRNGKDKPPVYDYRRCIRCFCCQEMCPKHAISVRYPLGRR